MVLHRSSLLGHGPRTTFNAGTGVRSGYVRGAGLVALLTLLYPVVWGCAEGGNVISVTGEMIWYGILDVLAGPVFLFIFLWELRGVDYAAFGLQSGKYTDQGAVLEKGVPVSAPVTAAPAADPAPATQ